MLLAAHIIPAGYVGEKIGDPFLAFLAGIILHFILDAIPHFDTADKNPFSFRQLALVVIDGLIGILIVVYILRPDLSIKSSFLWGMVGGILPDVFDVVPFWQKWFRKSLIGKPVNWLHEKIQFHHLTPLPGLLVQVIIVVVFSLLYLSQ